MQCTEHQQSKHSNVINPLIAFYYSVLIEVDPEGDTASKSVATYTLASDSGMRYQSINREVY